jgi:hypothetical protein
MIEFEAWFCQIVTTCELVASEDALWRTWVGGERTITSIIDFGELYEQVFGDLDAETCSTRFTSMTDNETGATIQRFLNLVTRVDSLVQSQPDLKEPATLLASISWRDVREAARAVIELPSTQKCRSGRDDIRI